jgi:ApaG protein
VARPQFAWRAKHANIALMRFSERQRSMQSDPSALELYRSTTRDIVVAVEPMYLAEKSSPENSYYLWAYRVHIENRGNDVVQLISRHWKITDAQGHVIDVRGSGVVGEQPVLRPGDSYAYPSTCPLSTPFGTMGGEYQMTTAEGEAFEVEIPTFILQSPFTRSVLN